MTLYEINNEIYSLIRAGIDPETGEISEETADKLNALEKARDEKLENIGLFIKNLLAEATACKAEAKAFTERAKSAESKAEWLKGYMSRTLEGQAFKTDRLSVTFRKSQAVEITDFYAIDDDFLRFKEPEIDKAKIREALKAGKEVKGAELVDKLNISIK